jgi:hypothetical protein
LTLEASFGNPIPEIFFVSKEQPLSAIASGARTAAARTGRHLREV